MTSMFSTPCSRIAAGLAAVLLVTSCAPFQVRSYSERNATLTQYRTFALAGAPHDSSGDARLDDNPFFHERVIAAIGRELSARGYEQAGGAEADLVVHYHASVAQEIDVNTLDSSYCDTSDCRPYVYEAGTLLIDLVDARTNRLVWRGWAEGSVEGLINDQGLMEERVDEAVAEILAGVPRRPSAA